MTGPRPRFRLVPSETYSAKHASLQPGLRVLVEWAEEDIADDPFHVHWRRQRPTGAVVDYPAAEAGFVIEFEVRDGLTVDLIDLIDQKSLRPL
jgi:hypothetical protein